MQIKHLIQQSPLEMCSSFFTLVWIKKLNLVILTSYICAVAALHSLFYIISDSWMTSSLLKSSSLPVVPVLPEEPITWPRAGAQTLPRHWLAGYDLVFVSTSWSFYSVLTGPWWWWWTRRAGRTRKASFSVGALYLSFIFCRWSLNQLHFWGGACRCTVKVTYVISST